MRRLHRALGFVMVLPLLAWLLSGGLLMLWGSDGEVESLAIPTRPLERTVTVRADSSGLETRLIGTVMGSHLLQRTELGWRHLDAATGHLKPFPTERQLRLLLDEALEADRGRFGSIELVTPDSIVTSRGSVIFFDWPSMTASIRGPGAAPAALVRRIHEVRISGDRGVDRWIAVGLAGAGSVLALLGLALLLGFGRQQEPPGRNR